MIENRRGKSENNGESEYFSQNGDWHWSNKCVCFLWIPFSSANL